MFHAFVKVSLLVVLLLSLGPAVNAKTVALALSGGGARGFAHIGILQVLEEENLEPDLIIGTSMGAVVGGLYSAGYSAAELRDLALRTDWSGLFLDRPARRNLFLAKKETSARHILSLRFRGWEPEVPLALSNGQKIWEKLFDLCARAPYQPLPGFDDLRIPFRAVATDLVTGKAVIFSQGDLAEALRATVSLPLVLKPYELDTLRLVDGGVIENIPVDLARSLGADVVIAVDLSTGFVSGNETEMPWDLADRVTTIMHIERNERSRREADLVITPDVGRHKSSDFSDIAALIDSGYGAARAQLQALRGLLHDPASAISAARGPSFCSRAAAIRFRADTASFDSVRAYRFHGTGHIPDTTVWRLPAGKDGFGKLHALRNEYVRGGHTLAHACALHLDSTGTLHSWWEEGRIRTIEVKGLRRYRAGMLLREFTLAPGDLWDQRRARRGVAQIYGSDLFESVTLSALPSDSGVTLTLRADERESPQMRLGAGFSFERRGRGFAEFLNDNILDLGARWELFGKYGERDEELRTRLIFDRFPFGTPLDRWSQSYSTLQLGAGWLREEYNFYSPSHRPTAFFFFERERGELFLGRAFRRWGEFKWGGRYEGVRAGGVFDEPTSHTTYLCLRALIDTKDTYPFPNSGIMWDGQFEYALKSRQTGRAFNRTRLLAEGYLPFHRRIVGHARGDWAWNDRILPLWAQFPLGGERSLLGLHHAERFGSARLTGMAEVRYDLISQWLADAYLSALYTVGAVSPRSDPLPASRDYQHGIGASLGLATLLGPITFTVGELLPSRFGPDHTHFYVNLGHEF